MTSTTSRIEALAIAPQVRAPAVPAPETPPDRTADAARTIWDAARVLAQLERILCSEAFDASARNRAFLRYVVNETLAGRADHIKGYTVAQEVFQRDADFDPQLDPVVRIEASRLRRSLERYYLTAGRHDRLFIDLPKGGYVPKFEQHETDTAGGTWRDAAAPAPHPVLVVRPFETLGAAPEAKQIAPGLADELIGRLAHYDGVTVVAESSAANALVPTPRCGAIGYVLQGTTRRSGRRLRISAQLLDYADGRYLWVRTFDRVASTKDLWALQEDLAGSIANAVAGPDGALATLRPR